MVVPVEPSNYPYLAVPLPRYPQILLVPECAFWGVRNPNDENTNCPDIWFQDGRDLVAKYLWEAQTMIEDELGYLLFPRWKSETVTDQCGCYVTLKYPYTIAGGIRAETDIQDGVSVNHAADPATISVAYAAGTDIDEVKIYHPGTDVQIEPSSAEISGGFYNAEIPRCRLVKWDLRYNDINGLDYSDITNFEEEVDIKRVYNDDSQQVIYRCLECSECNDSQYSGCVYVEDDSIGSIVIRPNSTTCRRCETADIYYYTGLTDVPAKLETAIVRLANSLMPVAPCDCRSVQGAWQYDQEIPEDIADLRDSCPWGTSNGAWFAWSVVQANILGDMGIM